MDKNKKPEVRKVKSTFEVRQEEDGDNKLITGYAAVTEDEAPEQLGFIEKIAEGAFENAIENSDVRALFNHDPNYILGRQSAGTLSLEEDDTGLFYEIDPPDTTYANNLLESLERGDIDESSFGFTVAEEKWDESGDIPVRTILAVEDLYDVGPVTRGWYPQTDSGVKSKRDVLREYKNQNKNNKKTKQILEEVPKLLIKGVNL